MTNSKPVSDRISAVAAHRAGACFVTSGVLVLAAQATWSRLPWPVGPTAVALALALAVGVADGMRRHGQVLCPTCAAEMPREVPTVAEQSHRSLRWAHRVVVTRVGSAVLGGLGLVALLGLVSFRPLWSVAIGLVWSWCVLLVRWRRMHAALRPWCSRCACTQVPSTALDEFRR